jgi:hypothetical protein
MYVYYVRLYVVCELLKLCKKVKTFVTGGALSKGGPGLWPCSPCIHSPLASVSQSSNTIMLQSAATSQFDYMLRFLVTKISNITLFDDQWTRASLLDRSVGFSERIVPQPASSAFLATAAGKRTFQTLIPQKSEVDDGDTMQSVIGSLKATN